VQAPLGGRLPRTQRKLGPFEVNIRGQRSRTSWMTILMPVAAAGAAAAAAAHVCYASAAMAHT